MYLSLFTVLYIVDGSSERDIHCKNTNPNDNKHFDAIFKNCY